MKKRVKNLNINISNRAFYSILTLAISIILVAGVFAFGTSTPSSFGHSAGELDLSEGVSGDAVFNGNLNVGGDIGVTGGIQTAGAIESTSGGIKLPDGTTILSSDDLGSSSSGGLYTDALINGVHNGTDCINAGGIPTPITNGDFVCKFKGGSCASGWTQYNDWSTTYPSTCASGCSGATHESGGHTFSDKSQESITFTPSCKDFNGNCFTHGSCGTGTCTASLQEIGCY